MSETEKILLAARRLLRQRLQGILSTHSLACPGFPFGSLVPYCLDHSASPVLLLSHLAQHTKNLQANPRVSLHISESGEGDAQTLQRLTLIALVQAQDPIDSDAGARYFRFFPQTRDYYEQLNFRFFRLEVQRCHFVGGFGAARWFSPDRVHVSAGFSAAAEIELVERLNQVGFERLRDRLRVSRDQRLAEEATEIVGADGLGVDLRCGDRLLRGWFPEEAADAQRATQLLLGGA